MYVTPLHPPKASILVLEEDPERRAGLCSLLTDAGYALAESACAASRTRRIDLVLAATGARPSSRASLDLLDHSAPVVLLTDRASWAGFDFLEAADAFGAVAVLQRPFSRSALLGLVGRVLSDSAGGVAPDDAADELPASAERLIRLEHPNFA